tara:strand:- start:898 stop:1821 length:924 start_codon:yes stop_codon:yes gene_type:complete
MKILYIDNTAQWCNYYKDIVETLKVNNDVLVKTTELSETVSTFKPDVVIIGFGITNCSGNKGPKLKIKLDVEIPIYVILNKEYAGLQAKMEWIKSIKPPVKKVFTVHQDYLKWQEQHTIPFTRIMWSADKSLFKKYDDIYKYDFFFSGVIREEQTGNLREKIHGTLGKLDKYKKLVKVAFFKNNKLSNTLYTFGPKEYAKTINHSRIVLTTTGPIDLVGTRYFEIMASNKALILCNRMPKEVYGDIVIDKMNCVMFDDENDFVEKCKYYLENEDERLKIVNKAYEYFLQRHTWQHKVKHLISNLFLD